jgi:hypothetical protein
MLGYVTGCGTVVSAGVIWYYYSHLEEDPITGRRKFIAVNKEQILKLAEIELLTVSSLYRVLSLQKLVLLQLNQYLTCLRTNEGRSSHVTVLIL